MRVVNDQPVPIDFMSDNTMLLAEEYQFSLQGIGGLTLDVIVPSGYLFDGASIPRALWTLVGSPMDPQFVRAALIHDWLCDHVVERRDRRLADDIFLYLLDYSNVPECKRYAMYAGVRMYALLFWKSKRNSHVQV